MLNPLNNYYLQKEEPIKSCLSFLRHHILDFDADITEALKYGMPFFCYKGKMICYLWVHKKHGQPYLGIVEGASMSHPDLIIEKRVRMKIFLMDANKDVPVKKVNAILKEMMALYK
jgi:hypothetical protein